MRCVKGIRAVLKTASGMYELPEADRKIVRKLSFKAWRMAFRRAEEGVLEIVLPISGGNKLFEPPKCVKVSRVVYVLISKGFVL